MGSPVGPVGAGVGVLVGRAVGVRVGVLVGTNVLPGGSGVGIGVGNDGLCVGSCVDKGSVGAALGATDGPIVLFPSGVGGAGVAGCGNGMGVGLVGANDGAAVVGVVVGEIVGNVGNGVGSYVISGPQQAVELPSGPMLTLWTEDHVVPSRYCQLQAMLGQARLVGHERICRFADM